MTNRILKIVAITFIVIFIIVAIALLVFFYVLPNTAGSSSEARKEITENINTEIDKSINGEPSLGEEAFLESENFIDTFSCFYFPDADIQDFKLLTEDENFFYILLNINDHFNNVESFYRNKKVQYIWNRSEVYESGFNDIEEGFLQDSDLTPTAKFTYYSNDKEKIVNVLINGISDSQTEVMVIYWELN